MRAVCFFIRNIPKGDVIKTEQYSIRLSKSAVSIVPPTGVVHTNFIVGIEFVIFILCVLKMESYQRFHTCFYKWDRLLLQCVGHDMLKTDFKIGLHAYCLYGVMVAFVIANVYTFLVWNWFTKMSSFIYSCVLIEV